MTTLELAHKLCKNKQYTITHISGSTCSIYLSYKEGSLVYHIRLSDHLKDKGNNYFDLLVIMSLDENKIVYSKFDHRFNNVKIDKY